MGFPMGVVLLFLGAVAVYIGSHGTDAKTPWDVYKQILESLGGNAPTAPARPADPWDAVGAAPAAGAGGSDGGGSSAGASGASGSSLSHRSRPAGSAGRPASLDDTIAAGQKILDSPDTTRADQAAAAAAQRRLDQIDRDLNQGLTPQWP